MNGSQQKIIVLMMLSLFGVSNAGTVAAEPIVPVPPVVPEIPTPMPSPDSALVQSSDPEAAPAGSTQDSLSVQTISPSSGINPQPATRDIQSEPYRLTVGDKIGVMVANVPEFSAEYEVQVDGTIDLLILGSVSVWGLTIQEVDDLLTKLYTEAEMLYEPTITVNLLAVSPVRIAISGEINRPGSYSLAFSNGKLPTLTQAIQQAGGITAMADLRQVTILRARRSGVDEPFEVNLWDLLQSGDLRQDITLRDGDSIILAAAPTDPSEAGLIGAATVSPLSMQIGILGEARQTGVVDIPPNTSLNQVLLAAGGLSNRASRNSIELIRFNRDGTVTRRKISVNFSDNVNEETNPILRNRDVVLVGRNFIARITDTLSAISGTIEQVFSSFTVFGTLLGPLFSTGSGGNTNVTIQTGGGSTTTTNQSSSNTRSNTSTNNASTNPAANTSPDSATPVAAPANTSGQ